MSQKQHLKTSAEQADPCRLLETGTRQSPKAEPRLPTSVSDSAFCAPRLDRRACTARWLRSLAGRDELPKKLPCALCLCARRSAMHETSSGRRHHEEPRPQACPQGLNSELETATACSRSSGTQTRKCQSTCEEHSGRLSQERSMSSWLTVISKQAPLTTRGRGECISGRTRTLWPSKHYGEEEALHLDAFRKHS